MLLLCHTELIVKVGYYNHEDGHFTVGQAYQVKDEVNGSYLVVNDIGDEHWFTKEPDEYGESYETWFVLIDSHGLQEVL